MADKHINIQLGSKFNGSGFSAALKSIRNLTRGAADIKAAFDLGLGAIRGAFEKIGSVVSSAFRFETQTRQFKTLIGDIDEAKAHMADLKALGDTPPFDLEQFAAASRSLMVMTDGVLGYKNSLEMIGDAAAATGRPIEEMGQAVGRLFATIRDGQPLSRAVMQLRTMGVITPEVAQKLQDLQAAGRSGAEIWAEVEAQLKRYNGAMKETEGTGDGLVSAIKSRWESVVRAFGDALADTAKGGMQKVLDKAKDLEENGTLETWAHNVGRAVASVVEAVKTAVDWAGKLVDAYRWVQDRLESAGAAAGAYVGTLYGGGSFSDAYQAAGQAKQDTMREQLDRARDAEQEAEAAREHGRQRAAERKAREAQRAAEEEERISAALAEGDRKRAEQVAADREKAELAAAQKIAKERERLERELHQKRMADLRAEIAAQRESAADATARLSLANSEFERAFAMYRDPQRAAEQIEEERDYAADLKRLHADAQRYGGKWRIDELSRLMSAGDTQGVQSRLEDWRRSRSFTPEVESMVRASAAERTKTTAEDELRKLNDKTAELTQKMDQLAQTRDGKLDGIERNTNQLASKIDELLSVK